MSSTPVEQIKDRLDIVDVLSTYIKLEKAGINYKAKCPFHNEKTPSFFVSTSRQSFYCFGCGEKGDIFSFVEKFEGVDFKEALETLAKKAGIEIKKFERNEKEADHTEKLFEVMEEATKFYEENLNGSSSQSEIARKYLKSRGVNEKTISKWRLGFVKNEWRELHAFLMKKGFNVEDLIEVGLLKKAVSTATSSGQENKYYDTFRGRIMFPICDSAGRVIAFSGRILEELLNPAEQTIKAPKYLNSPETKLFYKSEVLYGFHIAKNHIRKQDYAVLVEGQMDLIMSHEAGVANTVATSGTALTDLHLKKIGKLSNRIIIGFDADSAGENASRRAAEMALTLGMEVKIATLEKGEDPASIVRKDPERWKEAIKNSANFLDFLLDKAVKEKEGGQLTKEIFSTILPLLTLLKSEMEKSQFVKKIAIKTKVREDAVWEDLKKIPKLKDLKMESPESKAREPDKEKQEFMFEMERFMKEDDFKNIKKEAERFEEIKKLKSRLQELTLKLDDKDISAKEEEETKEEFKEIQKKIKEFESSG